MKQFKVTFHVRERGAIGINYPMTDVVESTDAENAKEAFRAKHGEAFELFHCTESVEA